MDERIDLAQWQFITDTIKGGYCVPFLGAGANVRSVNLNYEGLPVGAKVAEELSRKMEISVFKWDEIPGHDYKLRNILAHRFEISWSQIAEIHKTSDKRTIILSDSQDFILLRLNYNNTKVTITYLLCREKITERDNEGLIRYLNRSYQTNLSINEKMKK